MHSRSKQEEVQFYLDRSKHALVTVLRSIIENPRIEDGERLDLLEMLAGHHGSIAEFILERIQDGEKKAHAQLKAEGLS